MTNHLLLNHLLLSGIDENKLEELLKKLQSIKGKIELLVWEQIWSIELASGLTLREYLIEKSKISKEEFYLAAINLVNTGPFFLKESEYIDEIKIKPSLENIDARLLLLSAIFQEVRGIFSLTENDFLKESEYQYVLDKTVGKILHVLDIPTLDNRFSNIKEVFKELNLKGVILLKNAYDSSETYSFKKTQLLDVFNTIIALEKFLDFLNQGITGKELERKYYEETGFQVSNESTATLKKPFLRKKREFVIPESEVKALFSWHIKIGSYLRVHFYIDKEQQKIYIGHCGEHLQIE